MATITITFIDGEISTEHFVSVRVAKDVARNSYSRDKKRLGIKSIRVNK